jgi:hypothetical protein
MNKNRFPDFFIQIASVVVGVLLSAATLFLFVSILGYFLGGKTCTFFMKLGYLTALLLGVTSILSILVWTIWTGWHLLSELVSPMNRR